MFENFRKCGDEIFFNKMKKISNKKASNLKQKQGNAKNPIKNSLKIVENFVIFRGVPRNFFNFASVP